MQISAANLLLAGQQPRAAHGGQGAGQAFATALGQGPSNADGARATKFTPPSFESGAQPAAPAAAAPAEPAPKVASGYAAAARPGAQLDIRV